MLPKSLGLTHSVRGRLHPPGGLPGRPADGPGGACLSNAGQGGQGRAGEPLQGRACVPVFKAVTQAWTGSPAGQGHQLDRVTSWAGSLWVGPGRGCGWLCHRTRATRATSQPQASCRETRRATRATSQLQGNHKPARGKRWPAGGSWWGPGPAAVVNRGHPPANVTEQ